MSYPNQPEQLNAVILAGGRSTRMGFDKRSVEFHGQPHLEYLFDMLTALGLRVFTSCRSSDPVPAAMNPLFDPPDIQGPIAAITGMLMQDPDTALLTVPVDMPGVDANAIRELIANRDKQKYATCYFNPDTGRPEPLITIWEPTCIDPLMAQLKKRNFSPQEFLNSHPVKLITASNSGLFLNINSPGDLERFRQRTQEP